MVWHDSLAMARQQLCHGEVPNHRLPTVYTYYCNQKLPDVASSLDKAKAAHEVMLAQVSAGWRGCCSRRCVAVGILGGEGNWQNMAQLCRQYRGHGQGWVLLAGSDV